MIQRANLAYGDFIKSQEGMTFNGQVSWGVKEGKTESLPGKGRWLPPAATPANSAGTQASGASSPVDLPDWGLCWGHPGLRCLMLQQSAGVRESEQQPPWQCGQHAGISSPWPPEQGISRIETVTL